MAPKPASTASKAPATASKAPAKSAAEGGSKAGKKTSKPAASSGADGDKKKRKKSRKETYSSYIYKVLKQVHPDTGISNKAMAILNSFVNDIFERIATEASKLAAYSKKSTISSREIQTSVRLILPGELAKHAISEGTKSVTKIRNVHVELTDEITNFTLGLSNSMKPRLKSTHIIDAVESNRSFLKFEAAWYLEPLAGLGLFLFHSAHPSATSPTLMDDSSRSPPPTSPTPNVMATPTNDDIEAIIQMATSNSSRGTSDGRTAPRDTRTQLFVGNLPYRVRWQDLKDLFRKAGTVLRADVSLGPDNRSRGFGTVLLATAEDAGRAVDMYNGYEWQTRVLEVRPDRSANVGGTMPGGSNLGLPLGMSGREYISSATPSSTLGSDLLRDEIEFSSTLHHSGPSSVTPTSSIFPHSVASHTLLAQNTPAHIHTLQHPPFTHSQSAQNVPTSPQHLLQHSRTLSQSLIAPGPSDPLHQSMMEPFDHQRPSTGGAVGSGMNGLGASGTMSLVDGGMGGIASLVGGTNNPPNRTLFVGNLPFHVQWQDLKDLFRLSGPVLRADVALASDGRSRGFGTVVFRSEEEAERARRYFDGYDFSGRTLKVHFDKFSQSQAQLFDLPVPSSLSGMTPLSAVPLRGSSSSLLSSSRLPSEQDASETGYSPSAERYRSLHQTSGSGSSLLSNPVSPLLKEPQLQTHASPIPRHATSFPLSISAAVALSRTQSHQPRAFSPFSQSLPPSQPYSPVHQSRSRSPSVNTQYPQTTRSRTGTNLSDFSGSSNTTTPHRTSRAGMSDPQQGLPVSLSLPESLLPSSYPSPTPSSASAIPSSITESLLQSSSSTSRMSSAGRGLSDREWDRGGFDYQSTDRHGGYRERGVSVSSNAWERSKWSGIGDTQEADWSAREHMATRHEDQDGRRGRSAPRRDVSGGLDIDDLLQSLAISKAGEEADDARRGAAMSPRADTSAHKSTRRPPLSTNAGVPSLDEPTTPTSSWSPASTSASRSASAATSSGGMSFASSSVTSDQLSPKHPPAVPSIQRYDTEQERSNSSLTVAEDAGQRRANSETAIHNSDASSKPMIQHSHSHPSATQTKASETASSSTNMKSQPVLQQRRPGMRSPRHVRAAQNQQSHQQHPHHPGPITLPPVSSFIPPPHSLSPHGMMMVGMGSPVHGMSPLYHPGAHTTPTNATSAANAATPGYTYGPHGLHPSLVPMTPHGLPPITPSMPPFTFLPQPSPIHHHSDPSNPGMHYPQMMSIGMGGVTLASSPTQSSFTPTTLGPSSPHHHHMSQGYQHPAVAHHHMVTAFSPGVAMSPGSVYGRPGAPSNPFINPAVGAPVHMHVGYPHPLPSPGYYPPPHSFSPGEVQVPEPGGYFDNVYMYDSMSYGPIGPGTSTDVAQEIMKTKEEGGSGDVGLSTQDTQPVSESAESPEGEGSGGDAKPSRTYSMSSKRPEGLSVIHRSDSDPSMKAVATESGETQS
ncbi:hypothetical protein ONZ45_g5968 [Pleurotus djamor]|nr:hypothetical protein ONZ45_g5968 [Pleurotus djamor]